MTSLPVGIIILFVVSALIFFGVAHRALDRMKLSDKAAFIVIAGLIVGSFISIPLMGGRFPLSVNIGGALIPLGLAVYLVVTAGSATEKIRSIIGAGVTALVIYLVGSLVMTGLPEPGGRFGYIDTLWFFPIIAGTVGYLAGRSRRGAFVSATLGILIFDIGYYIWALNIGAPAGRAIIGGAGAFDAVVISGILAIILAETVGEFRERLAGGPTVEGKTSSLVKALRKPDVHNDSNITVGEKVPDEDEKEIRSGNLWKNEKRDNRKDGSMQDE